MVCSDKDALKHDQKMKIIDRIINGFGSLIYYCRSIIPNFNKDIIHIGNNISYISVEKFHSIFQSEMVLHANDIDWLQSENLILTT